MKVLVTGVEGQLARSLQQRVREHPTVRLECIGRPEIDLAIPGSAASAVLARRPDVVINAAAYTAVDLAEKEPELAFRINADAAGEIAVAAKDAGARIIQISTDYVFDGESDTPYREDARTGPINVYGRSKLAGEELVRAANPEHMIIRTSWVYSPFGRNFVKTMLRLAHERDEVRVVADQTGCPTSALDLADALIGLTSSERGWGATYHIAGSDSCSWAELAVFLFDVSRQNGGPHAEVEAIGTADYPTPARRPASSALDCTRAETIFDVRLPLWKDSVAAIVEQLVHSQAAGWRRDSRRATAEALKSAAEK